MMHTYNPQLMFLKSNNFLHLTVAEIYPGQDIIGQGHYGKVTHTLWQGQIKVRP